MRTRVTASRVASRARSPHSPRVASSSPRASRPDLGSPDAPARALRRVHLAARAEVDVEVETAETTFDPPWSAPGYRGAAVSSLPAAAGCQRRRRLGRPRRGHVPHVRRGRPRRRGRLPGYAAWSRSTWPVLGLTYVAAGLAHFALPGGFEGHVPAQGRVGFLSACPERPSFTSRDGCRGDTRRIGMASALLPRRARVDHTDGSLRYVPAHARGDAGEHVHVDAQRAGDAPGEPG